MGILTVHSGSAVNLPLTDHSCRCFWAGLQNLLNRLSLVSALRSLGTNSVLRWILGAMDFVEKFITVSLLGLKAGGGNREGGR